MPIWSRCGTRIFHKIVKHRTFFARKYMRTHEMGQNCACNNLGSSKPVDWPIVIKFLTCLVHQEFYFRCIWIRNFFEIFTSSPRSEWSKVRHQDLEISVMDNQNPSSPYKMFTCGKQFWKNCSWQRMTINGWIFAVLRSFTIKIMSAKILSIKR